MEQMVDYLRDTRICSNHMMLPLWLMLSSYWCCWFDTTDGKKCEISCFILTLFLPWKNHTLSNQVSQFSVKTPRIQCRHQVEMWQHFLWQWQQSCSSLARRWQLSTFLARRKAALTRPQTKWWPDSHGDFHRVLILAAKGNTHTSQIISWTDENTFLVANSVPNLSIYWFIAGQVCSWYMSNCQVEIHSQQFPLL